MTIQDRVRRHDAVYWARTSVPDEHGQYQYSEPEAVKVFWVPGVYEVQSKDGTDEVASVRAIVGQDMSPGDYLMLGLLRDAETLPKDNPTALQVKRFTSQPTLNGRQYVRQVYL